jgi:tRNA(Leu) C34 or U34 (ribose-2'-O)-methylase TrmL
MLALGRDGAARDVGLLAAGALAAICLQWALQRLQNRQAGQQQPPSTDEAASGEGILVGGHGVDGIDVHNRVLRKCETVLRRRTSRLLLMVERSNQSHNYTAIIRTAEAMGIQHLWVVAPPPMEAVVEAREKRKEEHRWVDDQLELELHVAYAKKASKWVSIRVFATTDECVAALRADGRAIWVTELSQRADALVAAVGGSVVALPPRLAVCFGSEGTGATPTLLAAADRRVYLPLHGFADSLNLSVSAAMIVQYLFHEYPELVGAMPDGERAELRKCWYPLIARKDADRARYAALADTPVDPFDDLRRPDTHRNGWVRKKIKKRNDAAGFEVGIGH